MIKTHILYFFLIVSSIGFSQNSSPEAYLNSVTAKAESYNNISIDFSYNLTNQAEKIKQTTTGSVYLKKEQYVLELLGVKQLFDGKKTYTINEEDEEITIINSSDEEEGTITPSKMFSFYKKGYTFKWDKKLSIKSQKIQYIKLTPIDSNAEINYVLLGVNSQTKHIYNLIEKGKNGTVTTLTVTKFKTNEPLSESLFIFDASKYTDFYINE